MPRIFSATYDPYTYDELSKPLKEATLYHQQVLDLYDTALLEAYKLNSMLDKERDKKSWKTYNDVVDTIYQMSDYLNTVGLDNNARANLMRVRMTNKDIYDISAAINRRQQADDAFNKSANGQSPRYIGKSPKDTSVDDWRGGRTPDLFGVNGELVSNYVLTAVSNISKQLYNDYTQRGYRISEVGINPQYRQGIIAAAMSDEYNGDALFSRDAVLNQYLNDVVKSIRQTLSDASVTFGMDLLDTDDQKRFIGEMFNGVQNGITYERQSKVDEYAMENTRFRHDMLKSYQNQLYDFYKDPTKWAYMPNGLANPLFGQTNPEESLSWGEHINYLKQNGNYDNLLSDLTTLGIDVDASDFSNKGSSASTIFDKDGNLKEQYTNVVLNNKDKKHVIQKNFVKAYEEYIKPLNDYIEGRKVMYTDMTGASVSTKPSLYQNYSDEELLLLYDFYKQAGYTKEVYNAFKNLGITNPNDYNGKIITANDVYDIANKKLLKNEVTIFGLTDDKQAAKIISAGLKTDEAVVKLIKQDGTRSKPIRSKEVPFLKKDGKKYSIDTQYIDKYGYDIGHPDEFIVVSSGKQYAVPLNIFTDEVLKAIRDLALEYMALNNNTITNLDAVAKILYDYFLTGNLPVYGNTITRNK